MDAKWDCEVDVEGAVGAVDMMVRGEEGTSINRRPCLRLTAHSPRASRQPPMTRNAQACGHSMLPVRRELLAIKFPVHTFTAVQPEQRSDIQYQDLLGPHILHSQLRV